MSLGTSRDPYRLTGITLNGKYRLEEYAGGGGVGAVYRAVDVHSGRQVAIKFLKPDITVRNPEYITLFEREVQAVRGLDHPNIVKLLDSGTDQDISYMVMEWLDGPTLEEVISQGQLSIDRIKHIFSQICDAFAVAHSNNIIHLDVKPGNIILLRDRQPDDCIKVIDFGMSKILTRESGTTVTRFGGTLQYCSPEHFGGKVSHLSDIYSLGATLYHLITGVLPFGMSYINAKRYPNLELPPVPSVRGIRPELPSAVDQVIATALNRNPKERQASALELFEDFSKAIGVNTTWLIETSSAEQSFPAGAGQRSLIGAWQKSAVRAWLLGILTVLMISSAVGTFHYLYKGQDEQLNNPNDQAVSQQAAIQPSPISDSVSPEPRPTPGGIPSSRANTPVPRSVLVATPSSSATNSAPEPVPTPVHVVLKRDLGSEELARLTSPPEGEVRSEAPESKEQPVDAANQDPSIDAREQQLRSDLEKVKFRRTGGCVLRLKTNRLGDGQMYGLYLTDHDNDYCYYAAYLIADE